MDFKTLQQVTQQIKEIDEFCVIGKDVRDENRFFHIVGMTRCGHEAILYLLEPEENFAHHAKDDSSNNRFHLKQGSRMHLPLRGIRIGEQKWETKSETSGCLGIAFPLEEELLFCEMEKAGWHLPKEHRFLELDWETLWLTRLTFNLDTIPEEGRCLSDWEKNEVELQFGEGFQAYFIEQPIRLEIGKEQEIPLVLENGENGICYINRVYPIDVWKEEEERFQDPRYRELVSEEELEHIKKEFFETLEENCPKGMCYVGIEYECTLKGTISFHTQTFLNSKPEEHTGSARMLLMRLKPEQETGSHGLCLHGAVIQLPVAPDIKQIDAELFQFLARIEKKKIRI